MQIMFKSQIVKCHVEHQIRREVEIMCHLRHPHVLQLYTYFWDKKRIYLVLEYAINGQMYSDLQRARRYDERKASTVSPRIDRNECN